MTMPRLSRAPRQNSGCFPDTRTSPSRACPPNRREFISCHADAYLRSRTCPPHRQLAHVSCANPMRVCTRCHAALPGCAHAQSCRDACRSMMLRTQRHFLCNQLRHTTPVDAHLEPTGVSTPVDTGTTCTPKAAATMYVHPAEPGVASRFFGPCHTRGIFPGLAIRMPSVCLW